jgi:hypothetical protein
VWEAATSSAHGLEQRREMGRGPVCGAGGADRMPLLRQQGLSAS